MTPKPPLPRRTTCQAVKICQDVCEISPTHHKPLKLLQSSSIILVHEFQKPGTTKYNLTNPSVLSFVKRRIEMHWLIAIANRISTAIFVILKADPKDLL